MKKARCIAILPMLLLWGCASVGGGGGGGDGAEAPRASTYYCWKDTLNNRGDTLACNWESNRMDACRLKNHSTLARDAIASGPEDAGRCDNGQWLVKVTTR